MTLQEVFDDYLSYLKVEQGCTHRTVQSYASWSRHFLRYLVESGTEKPALEDFNPLTLKRYLYHLAGRKLRPRTIRAAFHPLKGLGKYLFSIGAVPQDPAAQLRLPKLDAARRELVSDDEVRAILMACERQGNTIKVARDRAILSVLCYGALRRQECMDLKVDDINLAKGCLIVRQGKGQKSRTVYPHPDCIDALREWLALRPKDTKHDWLFSFGKSRRICRQGLARMLEDIKAIAGLADHDNIKPHSLRHNCATRLLENGADMRTIQAFLGHGHLSTTAVYLHTDEQQLRGIASMGRLEPKQQTEDNTRSERRKRSRLSRHVRRLATK